jgi:hypothetical protein
MLGVLALVCLSTAFFVETGSGRQIRLASGAAVWVLLPIIPVLPIFLVAEDLQSSRYLYLSTVGWAALVIVLAAGQRGRRFWEPLAFVAVVGLIIISSYGTGLHLAPWTEAARLRDRVEASALGSGMDACQSIRVSDPPDSVRGAYVFRNGLSEAFARDLHLNVIVAEGRGQCSFRWNDSTLAFVRAQN